MSEREMSGAGDLAPVPPERPLVVVSATASDAHTWNLVYLQLLLEELGYDVANLGPCVPDELLLAEAARLRPAAVVISSVNGHGVHDGKRLIGRLRAAESTASIPVIVGGKLGIAGDGAHLAELVAAGFDAVFDDSAHPVTALRDAMRAIGSGPPALPAGSATAG